MRKSIKGFMKLVFNNYYTNIMYESRNLLGCINIISVEAGPSFSQLSSPRNSVGTGSPAASSPMSERPISSKV